MTDYKFKSPTGMHDIFGENQRYFERIFEVSKKIAREYNFEKIETPILEDKKLFEESIGNTTDIVEKEMYDIKTKGGEVLALRPEGTAPIVRSYIQKDMYTLPQPVKLFYFGPFFRYERPQRGRYRQFWQFGLETIGKGGAALDSQIIKAFYEMFKELGIDTLVEVNNIGGDKCRPEYKKLLQESLKSQRKKLCENCKRRLKENPLRVLDCKEEECQEALEDIPQIIDKLCDECKEEFKSLLEYLDDLEVPYKLNPYLVRGLDYYSSTVFEFFVQDDHLALGGGGRYDKLVDLFGGKESPASGGAMGVERIIEAMKGAGIEIEGENKKVFLAQLGGEAKRKSLALFEEFRKEGIPVYECFGGDSLKNQLSRADKLGVDFVLIMGRQECIEDKVMIREMESGKQETVKIKEAVKKIKKKL